MQSNAKCTQKGLEREGASRESHGRAMTLQLCWLMLGRLALVQKDLKVLLCLPPSPIVLLSMQCLYVRSHRSSLQSSPSPVLWLGTSVHYSKYTEHIERVHSMGKSGYKYYCHVSPVIKQHVNKFEFFFLAAAQNKHKKKTTQYPKKAFEFT